MEEASYSDLKNHLSSVPAKALNYRSRFALAKKLDIVYRLTTKNHYARDYRGLAEQMGFQYNDVKQFERNEDSTTMKILDSWETDPDATLDKLIEFLAVMERHDVIGELIPFLKEDVKIYLEAEQKKEVKEKKENPVQVPEVTSCPVNLHSERGLHFFTLDDITTGECTYYDAYVSYADDDLGYVFQLAEILESPRIGLKLFIRDRDLLAGAAEVDIALTLIKERCRRMLIILTRNYFTSTSCEYQTSFAASLAIDQSKRILIPVILEACEIPSLLRYVSKIDFTKPGNWCWIFEKLINSLLPEGSEAVTLSRAEKDTIKETLFPSLGSSNSNENTSAITYHPTNQLCYSDTNSSAVVPNENVRNSSPVQSKTKKWFISHFNKTARISSNGYLSDSSSSNATSGFHSQSYSTSENLDGSVEGYKTSL